MRCTYRNCHRKHHCQQQNCEFEVLILLLQSYQQAHIWLIFSPHIGEYIRRISSHLVVIPLRYNKPGVPLSTTRKVVEKPVDINPYCEPSLAGIYRYIRRFRGIDRPVVSSPFSSPFSKPIAATERYQAYKLTTSYN